MTRVYRAVGFSICFLLAATFASITDTMASGTVTQEAGSFGGTAISSTEIRWSTEGVFGGVRYELHTADHEIIGEPFFPADPQNPPAEIVFNETGLEPGTEYCRHVLVEIVTSPGIEVESEEVCVTTLSGSVPPTPTNFRGTAISTSEILWEWDDVSGETSYEGHDLSGNVAFSVPANTTSFTEGGFGPGTTVTRHLHSRNSNGLSQQTTTVTITTEEAGTEECIVLVSPDCANEPGDTITFVFILLNLSDETKHFVVTQDMTASLLFSLPKGETLLHTVQVSVGATSFRLHPKAWCKIFDEGELKPAQELQMKAQDQVDEIQKQLKKHSTKRMVIAMKEDVLTKAIEKDNENQINNLIKQMDKLETKDEEPLNKIKDAQMTIRTDYGKPPDADAFIAELNVLGFNNDFKHVPDSQEEDPGVLVFANTDDDDENDFPDRDDINVADEDELGRLFWFFARPVDVTAGFSVCSESPKLKFWKNNVKSETGSLPIGFTGPFERRGVYVEAIEGSTDLSGELVEGTWTECQDKLNVKATEVKVMDKDEKKTDHIQVARWNDAFENGNVKDSFVRDDEEKFFVQVTDVEAERKGRAKVTVKLKTTHRDNSDLNPELEFEIDKKGGEPGVYRMSDKPQMLMSDKVDDEFKDAQDTGQVDDNQKNDRTYEAEPEGDLVVEYTLENGTTKRPFKFQVCDKDPKEIKEVTVNLIFLTVGGKILAGEPFLDENGSDLHDDDEPFEDVNGNKKYDDSLNNEKGATRLADKLRDRMNELLAQCCVRVKVSVVLKPAPDRVKTGFIRTSSVNPNDIITGFLNLTADEQAIFGAGHNTATQNDVEVYMLRGLRTPVGGAEGLAYSSDKFKGMPAARDINDSFFLGTDHTLYAPAHELVHILRQMQGHETDVRNLLHRRPTLIVNEDEKKVTDTKRLTKDQCDNSNSGIRNGKAPDNTDPYAKTPE